MSQQVRVLIIADYFAPAFRAGGPVRSLTAVVELPIDADFSVLTRHSDLGSSQPLQGVPEGVWVPLGAADVLYVNTGNARSWLRALKLLRQRQFEVWYLNSLFSPLATLLPLLLRRAGLAKPHRVVLAPRGELSPGALRLSRRKKRVVLRALEVLQAFDGVVWHATSLSEEEEIRSAVGKRAQEVQMVTQMARLPAERPIGTTTDEPSAPTRVVFLSRISRKKNLLGAVSGLAEAAEPTSLRIYGPVEDSQYWNECLRAISALPARHTVRYGGEVVPDRVADVLSEAEVFLFPTFGENFGHVIFEGLASGCYMILGKDTPWTGKVDGRCGRVVDPDNSKAIGHALDMYAGLTQQRRLELRAASVSAAREWADAALDDRLWSSLLLGKPLDRQ